MHYYGVIGNRDYIKIAGQKRPYWEFLDRQPDGWLSSLVYKRKDCPQNKPMIWDCGAWSYKDKEVADYTPASALEAYSGYAAEGSTLIAPDHMLIDGVDLEARRRFNKDSAAEFLDIVPSHFQPMACIHGMTLEERISHAEHLMRLGYKHIAVGGVAARAAQKSLVISTVAAIREVTRGARLHVLGLSSPEYMAAWRRLGVDSCDGSSHFKQAFTGGAFFTRNGAKLIKHQAARPGNSDCAGITAPECHCKACTMLRNDGIDTRSFGSNENNMGRAAHNQNILMEAHLVSMAQRIGLVACCGPKLDYSASAQDLYTSPLFTKSRAWVEANCDRWFILSAKHGLVLPSEIIDPYNETLSGSSKAHRISWASKVAAQMAELDLMPTDSFQVLAGNDYCDWIGLVPQQSFRPMQGLGIGQQLQWLTQSINQSNPFQGVLFQ